ncbi:MAG: rRNA maturation RNase YbeY [Tannerellaceae bacterium]|jgi:rRNA maturation RNase YbeY|nr:rRNA maturation RNase YbeY [Tannerellaceae bacterium]
MAIRYHTEHVSFPPIRKRATSAWIKSVATSFQRKAGEINYLFCDDEKILEVNRQYLKHDYYTDIITFDYSDGDTIAGDLVISLDTVASNAQKYHVDFIVELHRVIIHGILHLCGIEDKGAGQREVMERNENRALALLFGEKGERQSITEQKKEQ